MHEETFARGRSRGARERSQGSERTFAMERENVRKGARERSRGGEGTFVRGRGNVRERRPSGPPYETADDIRNC